MKISFRRFICERFRFFAKPIHYRHINQSSLRRSSNAHVCGDTLRLVNASFSQALEKLFAGMVFVSALSYCMVCKFRWSLLNLLDVCVILCWWWKVGKMDVSIVDFPIFRKWYVHLETPDVTLGFNSAEIAGAKRRDLCALDRVVFCCSTLVIYAA